MTKRKVTDLLPTEAILISSEADLKVLEEFEKAGYRWRTGELPTNTNWHLDIPSVLCRFSSSGTVGLFWETLEEAEQEKLAILPASDFIPTEPERGLTIIEGDAFIITVQSQDGRVFDIEPIPTEAEKVEVGEIDKLIQEVSNGFNGQRVFSDLMSVGNIKNEDGMSVIEYLDKPNGGSVAYVRYDAIVSKLNSLVKQLKTRNTPNQ